jgi:hypothetical protein
MNNSSILAILSRTPLITRQLTEKSVLALNLGRGSAAEPAKLLLVFAFFPVMLVVRLLRILTFRQLHLGEIVINIIYQ